jgi:hypothetical protein
MRAMLVLWAVLLAWPAIGSASTACPVTSKDRAWSATCLAGAGSSRAVKPAYRKSLRFNAAGFAAITIDTPRGIVIVDRRGKVVIPEVDYGGEFGFPHGRSGRIGFRSVAGKCGYIDARTYRLAIAARFDHCRTFEDPVTLVCTDCMEYCTEEECQNTTFINGQGFRINRFGKVLGTFPLPALEQACRPGRTANVTVRGGDLQPYLRCIGHPLSIN